MKALVVNPHRSQRQRQTVAFGETWDNLNYCGSWQAALEIGTAFVFDSEVPQKDFLRKKIKTTSLKKSRSLILSTILNVILKH